MAGETAFFWTVAMPVVGLMAAAWLVPRALALFFPEGARWLILLAGVAAALLWLASGLYLTGGVVVPTLIVSKGALAALIWAPVMVLSVAGLPAKWKEAVW
ncbi:hypothetical protein [Nereida sp. MMG025]|uniref:hypothetical protein n=1 Tax=Nereida sp. MMG025 TaxID=2909981 RepID=UPI001F451BCF|nr:hypothetical protein [Nereida sp. MMG025]MCF6445467.1 hypothetical protein [Nereida sp. MMG025]